MPATLRHARCACGAVVAETRGAPERSMLCSCADCRRKTGSAFNWTLYWPQDAVSITGDTRAFRRAAQDGRASTYHFGPSRGVAIWWKMDALPGEIAIGGGFFDEMDLMPPTNAYWTQGRPVWATRLDDIPAKEQQ